MNTYWLKGTRSGSITTIPQMNHLIDPGYRDARRLSEPFYKSSDTTRISSLNETLQRKRNSDVKFQELQNDLSYAINGSHKYAMKAVDEIERKVSIADSGISMDKIIAERLDEGIEVHAIPNENMTHVGKCEGGNSPLLGADEKCIYDRNGKLATATSGQTLIDKDESNPHTLFTSSSAKQETEHMSPELYSPEREKHKININLDNISEHSESASIIDDTERLYENCKIDMNEVSNDVETIRL